MTQYTPNLNLPYPEAGDAPRGNEQIQALAETLDGQASFPVAHGLFMLTQNTTLSEDRQTLPLTTVSAAGCTMSDGVITFTQPGMWFVQANATANGNSGGTGGVYFSLTNQTVGTPNYGSADYSSGRRYAVTVSGIMVASGTGTNTYVQGWYSQVTAGNANLPYVGGLSVYAICVKPNGTAPEPEPEE